MVYVDDLLFTGEDPEINRIFEQIQQHMLLRPTGESTPGSTVSFLGRQITNRGNYYEITLGDSYIDNILQEAQLETCNPATTPGATTTKETVEDEELLNVEQHKQYRRMVGKLQWLSYTRPDMAYATKELARGLQQPTVKHQKKLKHLIRYLKGTKHYKFCISPTVQLRDDNMPLDMWQAQTATGQAVTPHENQQQDLRFKSWEQQCILEAEHKQQWRSQAQKASSTPLEQQQQKHYSSRISYRRFSATERSTLRLEQIRPQERAWQQGLEYQDEPNTLISDSCSSNS